MVKSYMCCGVLFSSVHSLVEEHKYMYSLVHDVVPKYRFRTRSCIGKRTHALR